jgi:lysozyme|tara:strand:+ start:2022 stop:2465 length:444 start_codon:yes stop_codon:yes gene_type:complete
MMDRARLLEELMLDEGVIHEIYNDHLGYPTFGVGHLITEKDEEHGKPLGTPVSEERVTECLNADVDIVCAELDKNMEWWRELNDTRQRVMANMCFNLGYPRLSKFKKFLAAVQEEDWETAAVEMMDSKWATQVGDRAVRLREKMLNG